MVIFLDLQVRNMLESKILGCRCKKHAVTVCYLGLHNYKKHSITLSLLGLHVRNSLQG